MELLSDAPDIWQRCWNKRSAFDRHPTILGPIQQSPRSQAVQSPLEFDITEDQQSTSSQSTPVTKLEIVEAWNTNLSGLATDQRY
jgi:hypothetical protein